MVFVFGAETTGDVLSKLLDVEAFCFEFVDHIRLKRGASWVMQRGSKSLNATTPNKDDFTAKPGDAPMMSQKVIN